MAQLADLQIDQHVAAKQTVVEHQIDEEVLLVEGESLLSCLEEKALAELEQEVLELVDDGGFEV